MSSKIFLTIAAALLVSAATFESLRISNATQALETFRSKEISKVKSLIKPLAQQQDDVSELIETIVADGKVSLQEYQWLTGAMVHRFKNVDPRVAATMLDAGYRTSLELDKEHQTLKQQVEPLAWLL